MSYNYPYQILEIIMCDRMEACENYDKNPHGVTRKLHNYFAQTSNSREPWIVQKYILKRVLMSPELVIQVSPEMYKFCSML